ncbi:MAG: hypothetical protein ACI90Y_002272, partial [Polaromonas sp.]
MRNYELEERCDQHESGGEETDEPDEAAPRH